MVLFNCSRVTADQTVMRWLALRRQPIVAAMAIAIVCGAACGGASKSGGLPAKAEPPDPCSLVKTSDLLAILGIHYPSPQPSGPATAEYSGRQCM